MNENSSHSIRSRGFQRFFWLAVIASLLGTAATIWQLAFFGSSDLSVFEKPRILRSLLIDTAIALVGIVSLAWVFKWASRDLRRWHRWFFTWRSLKRCALGLASLLVLTLLFCVEENWRGKRDWEKCRREWEVKGEHFNFEHFIPPPVADEQNFALTPVVASCYSRVMDCNGQPKEPDDTNVVNRLGMELCRTELPANTNLLLGSWQKSKLTNLKAWQEYYRTKLVTNGPSGPLMMQMRMLPPGMAVPDGLKLVETNATQEIIALNTNEFPIAPQPQTPAQDVLLALSKYDSAIEELRQASRLPHSRFPLNYKTNNPLAMIFPHYKSLKSVSAVLRLRAVAELRNAQTENALADIRLILYLANSIRHEPTTWSLRTRMEILEYAFQPIWEGLVSRQWSDDQLADLERQLARFDALGDYIYAVRSERALQLKSLDYLRAERMANAVVCMCGDTIFWPTLAYRLSPSGWFYLNQLTVARYFQAALPTRAEHSQKMLSPDIVRRLEEFERLERHPHLIPDNWSLSFIPPPERAAYTCARTQTSVDMAWVACALERCRLAHGGFPESLDALAPQFIENVPHDIINGQPLHYRRTADGLFLLYSVGWNGKDDGGELESVGLLDHLTHNHTGDWVWRFPSN